MEDLLDVRCIRLDAEMEMARVGDECIKQDPNAEDPCGLCMEYGFCFREPTEKMEDKTDGSEKEEKTRN